MPPAELNNSIKRRGENFAAVGFLPDLQGSNAVTFAFEQQCGNFDPALHASPEL
jgi:hypothetical protein